MTEQPDFAADDLTVAAECLVDEVCDAFEAAWKAGQGAQIEDYLGSVPSESRNVLLRELLLIELHYQTVGPGGYDNYLGRFPELDPGWLAAVVDPFSAGGTAHAGPGDLQVDTPCILGRRNLVERKDALKGRRLGDYLLLEELGRGGMGVIYKARHIHLGRVVAIKFILSGELASEKERHRFQVEAEAAANLDHPNIVPVYEFGEHEGYHYLTMKLVEGGSLAERFAKFALSGCDPDRAVMSRSEALLRQRQIARLLSTVARAVHYAHQRGILHRDLKPANILLDEQGEPLVTDFGLARRLNETAQGTPSSALGGTPGYMAPEMVTLQGKRVSVAMDTYALGVILYELLTGKHPFQNESPLLMLQQVVEKDPVCPRTLQPLVDRDLEIICIKCIQKEPNARYACVEDLALDLNRFERGEPILARRSTTSEKLWRWCRRHPGKAVAGGVIALLSLILVVGSSVAALVFRQQRNEVETQSLLVNQEKERAVAAERSEREKRAEALVQKTQSSRLAGRIGSHWQGLQDLNEAAALLRSAELPGDRLQPRLLQLRNEAIACMAVPDVKVVKHWNAATLRHGGSLSDIDPEHLHYAKNEDDGSVTVWRVEDNQCIATLHTPGASSQGFNFSPNGRLLAVRTRKNGKPGVAVWEVATSRLLLDQPLFGALSLTFTPDSSALVIASQDGNIHEFDLAMRKQTRRLKTAQEYPSGLNLSFSPDGQYLAISTSKGEIQVWEWQSGQQFRRFSGYGRLNGIDWRPDGALLAAGCVDGQVYLWDVRAGRQWAVLSAHKRYVDAVAFHPNGELLATSSWDGTIRLWDLHREIEIWKVHGKLPRFNADGSRLAYCNNAQEFGIWELTFGGVCRHLRRHHDPDKRTAWVVGAACSPDNRFLATCGWDGVRLWDRANLKEVGHVPLGYVHSVAFHPVSGQLFTAGPKGLLEWPMRVAAQPEDALWQLGPPKVWDVPGYTYMVVDVSGDGSTVVARTASDLFAFRDGKRVRIVDRQGNSIAVDPSGQWLAADSHSGNVHIYNAKTGELLNKISTPARAELAFSPDGRWLVTSSNRAFKVWQTGTWQVSYQYPVQGIKSFCFSPKGDLLAIGSILAGNEPNAIDLVEPATGKLLARLEDTPAPSQIEKYPCFSADGTQLIVPYFTDLILAVWDLKAIREELQGMGLDWDAPSFPITGPTPTKPIRLEINRGFVEVQALMNRYLPRLYHKSDK